MKPEQITAWALDEASTEERQQLEAALLENPQDKEKADETKAFCDFLLSELRDDSLALTDKQRERLVAQAAVGQSPGLPQASETPALRPDGGTPALRPPGKGVTRWNFGVIVRLSLAACAVLGGFWTWQAYSGKQTEVHALAAVAEKAGFKVQHAPKPEAKRKAGQGPETRPLAAKPVKPVIVADQPAAQPLAAMPKSEPVAIVSALALNKDQTGMSRGDVEQLKQIQDQNAYGLSFGDRMKVPVTPLPGVLTLKTELAAASVGGDLNGGLVGSGKGVNTQMTKPEAAGAALGLVEGRGALVGACSSWVQEGTDTVSLNAVGILTLAGTVSGSPGARLTMTPDATALMKQAQERPAASLSLKAGTRLYSSFGREQYFINGSSLSYASAGGTFAIHPAPRVKVTYRKMGIVSGLLPGVQNVVDASGYPWMSTAPLELISAADEAEQHASLAEYQAAVAFGDIGLYNRGSASLVLNAANASTGSILVQSGAHLTLNAFLQQRRWALSAFSTPSSMGGRYFKGIGVGFPLYGWIPMPQELNTTSAGVISFATNANSQFNASLEKGAISAEDQSLLGGLFPRDQFLPGISAALADASGASDLQAAVFNVTALSKSSSDASTVLGSGGVLMKDVAGNSAGKNLPLNLMSAPMVTTKAGTRATMAVTREYVYPGGTTVSNPAEPTMAFRNLAGIWGGVRAYMGANRFVVGDTDRAASNYAVGGTNSLAVGCGVSGAPFGRRYGATLDLNGASNYTGDTTINGGVMTYSGYVGAAPAAPAQAGSVTLSGGTAAAAREGETFAGIVSLPGGITKAGAGKLVVSGANTYTGATTISAGTLQVSNGATSALGNAVSGTGVSVGITTSAITANSFSNTFTGGVTVDRGATIHGGNVAAGGSTYASAAESTPSAGTTFAGTLASTTGNTAAGASLTMSGADTLTLTGATTYTGTTTAGGVQNPQAGTVGSSKKPSASDPASGDLGMTASVGYDALAGEQASLSAKLGKDIKKLSYERRELTPTAATDNSPASVSFGYSFIQNMGSLANAGGVNLHSDSVGGFGMNDIQQMTLGSNSNLGSMSQLDLNEAAKVAAAATSNAGAAPMVLGGWATMEGKEFAAFSISGAGVQIPQAPEASPNTISTTATPLAGDVAKVQTSLMLTGNYAAMGKDSKNDDFYLIRKATPVEEQHAPQTQPGTGESYTRIIENELKDVAREPLSTLSIDVDTASYANVRRFLNQNMIPPPDAVRIEELVNYFPTAEEGPAHEAKEPFGVRVELAPCPWQPVHRLARIAIKGREMDKNRKASNLVFLVDVSGSMGEPNKLPLVQQSLRMLTEQLGEGDRVTMVVYAGSSGVVLPTTSGEKKVEILEAIGRLSAGGSTHGSEGIKLAYEQAVAGFIKGGVNRVILCTDGDFNVGVSSPEELEKLIKHKAKSGVFLSVLGFGSGNLKDRTMETLADKGNGNYAYIDSLSEARKVLVEQMSGTLVTIAKDVKIQVEFNPAAVRSYRLIGYENRLLAKEDFNDDTKDAGEIGAGHSVVALYEIVPANLPPGAEPRPLVDSLKYQAAAISSAQLAAAAKTGEMMTVKLRYKEPESDLSKLIEVPTKDEGKTLTASSEEYKFSAAVAGFGLLLRDSSYKGTLSWETVRRLALDGKGADKLGYRGEFLQLIDKARGLKETK